MFGSHGRRVLIVGVALFDNMKQRELCSILAHEYGHFRNADTGGGLALAVRRSLLTLLRGISNSGYALFNPAWWLLRAFTNLYLVVSSGASRLQEMLADRWAIRAYGSEAFSTCRTSTPTTSSASIRPPASRLRSVRA
jgi:Zn-dependent protease with chaperone function